MALAYTELPAAPAVEFKASTSGTPAANVVDSVRENRAMTESCTIQPTTGALSINLSTASEKATERSLPSRIPKIVAMMPPSIRIHHSW